MEEKIDWMEIIKNEFPIAYEHTRKQLVNSGSQTLERLYLLEATPINILREAFKKLEEKLKSHTNEI